MSELHILIVYGSRYGQTAKIASYMRDLLTADGAAPTVVSVDNPRNMAIGDFDGVIVGSPILYGRHLRSVERFVREHRDALNAVTSAFFSVSGSAASRDEAELAAARKCVNEFLNHTGWQPSHTDILGGAISYTKYNPCLRWVMKRLSQKKGGPTDTSRDHEVTDWLQVRQFVDTFLALTNQASEVKKAAMK